MFSNLSGSDYETYLRVLLYDTNYLGLALCGMLSEICYWKFAIYVFFLRLATPCKEIVIFRNYSATRNFFLLKSYIVNLSNLPLTRCTLTYIACRLLKSKVYCPALIYHLIQGYIRLIFSYMCCDQRL